MIRVIYVAKRFVGKKRTVIAARDISFEASEGELNVLMGPSGEGKSVVLNMIVGFIKPDSGRIFINDEEATRWSWGKWNTFRRKYIIYGPQRNILIPNISVEDNIGLPLYITGYSRRYIIERVRQIMEKLNIISLMGRKTYTLSGNEQRRVIVARTLIKNAPIVILDEPTSNLDRESADTVIKLIKNISRDRIIITATHDEKLIEIGDKIIKIEDGYAKPMK